MASLGETLRRARTKRRIGLEEIARETRIDARYLSALEKNDLDQLPGGAFDRGFVRTYAGFLGLDTDAMVQAYDREVASLREAGKLPEAGDLVEEIRGSVGHRSLPSRLPRWRWGLLLGAGLLLAFLLAARLWYLLPEVEDLGSHGGSPTAETTSRDRIADAAGAGAVPREAREAGAPPPPSEDLAAATSEGLGDQSTPSLSADASPRDGVDEGNGGPDGAPRDPTSSPPGERGAPTPPPEASPAPPSALEVPEAAVGSAVVDLQLRGRGDRFEPGQSVYFWTRILGGSDGQLIRHVWRHEGQQVGYVPLELGGAHWRTYSRRELPADRIGRWTVQVVDDQGRVLAKASFECVPAPSSAGMVAAEEP
jgi:cytoskeletal protein RodZ